VAGLARVRKQARIEKNALICDFAEATDEVRMTDDSQANGHAHMGGWVRMEDESTAGGHARLMGTVLVSKRGCMGGNAFLTERCVITDNAFVHGSFVGAGTMQVGGDTWTGRKVDANLGLGAGLAV
jgi:UDP-3-O-[3-hydroxymyristoyl] glucosamine N-acyltransferase